MDSEEEELEALRKWWQDNGRSLVIGLVVGLGGVFGWQSWQAHVDRRGEQASVEYQKIADAALREDHDGVMAQAGALISEFPKSGYAPLAALIAARSAFESGQPDEARRHLVWTVEHAGREGLVDLARLRLARIDLDAGRLDEAETALGAVGQGPFDTLAAEIRGDLSLARGDTEAARDAYAAALGDEELTPDGRSRLQMKLDDLGPGAPSG